MALGLRAGWPIAVSSKTLGELEATIQPYKRLKLVGWGNELDYYFTSHSSQSQVLSEGSSYSEICHFTFHQRLFLSDKLEALPHENDRCLIIDALEYGCDIFLTMDYKSIWRHRDEVKRCGIQVMRPVELLEHIRPYAGLLR